MATTLLATKLYIPTPGPQLIPRARLAGVIDAALRQGCRLVLLAAPAGFGKTTAVAEWVAARTEDRGLGAESATRSPQSAALGTRVAWLSLDDDDNRLDRFLTYLIAAIESVRPGVGQQARALLHAAEASPPARAILTELLNVLTAAEDRLVLVLEDYHTINDDPIHEAVALLIDRMPPQMHLIITSRADPPLPLARLRARRQLAELRAADLRFTPGEAADLLVHCYGLHLTPQAISALVRTHLALERHHGAGDMPGVARLLDRLLQAAEAAGRMREAIEILVLQAQVYAALCERDAAAQVLIRALVLAESEGYVRTFIDEGPPLLELLAWPEVQRAAPAYTQRLAHAAGISSDRAPPASAPVATPSILTEREVAILHLLAQGQSIQEIAATLIISVHTARTHVKNIYPKLEAHNRAQAIQRAHDLHLL